MSRSTERGSRLAAAGLLVVAAVGLVAPAYAEGEGPHVWAPDHLPAPEQARVYPLQARAYPLTAVSEDTAGTAEIEDGPRRLDVVLDSNVLFAKDSAVIRPEARRRLDRVVAALARRTPGVVRIDGYTDDLGSAAHGLVLSRQRAAAVRAILAPRLAGFTLRVKGYGEADPRVPNIDEAHRRLNRRVELHYGTR